MSGPNILMSSRPWRQDFATVWMSGRFATNTPVFLQSFLNMHAYAWAAYRSNSLDPLIRERIVPYRWCGGFSRITSLSCWSTFFPSNAFMAFARSFNMFYCMLQIGINWLIMAYVGRLRLSGLKSELVKDRYVVLCTVTMSSPKHKTKQNQNTKNKQNTATQKHKNTKPSKPKNNQHKQISNVTGSSSWVKWVNWCKRW